MKARIKKETENFKLPIIGKIKIGEKVIKNGKEFPTSLDYFKAVGDYASIFHDIYGDKPKSIQIAFLNDNDFESCYERMEIYKGSKLYASGDGETFNIYSEKTGEFVEKLIEKDKLDEFLKFAENKAGAEWHHTLTLRFMIRGVSGIMGVWQFDTRAEKSTIQNIVGTYDKVKSLGGTVTRTMFDFKVEKVTSNKYGNKNRFPVVTLIPNMTADSLSKIKTIDNKKDLPLLLNDSILNNM